MAVATPGEKLIGAELVAALTVAWIAHVYQNKTAPKPEQILGIVMLYGALSLLALAGPGPARLGAGLGALVLLVILVKRAGSAIAGAGVQIPEATRSQLPGYMGPLPSKTPPTGGAA